MWKAYKFIKKIYDVAGIPGKLLIGYNIVLTVFARTKADAGAIDFAAVIFAGYALGAGLYCYRLLGKNSESSAFCKFLVYKSPILFFVLYTSWCFISAIWSPNMALTAYRSVECMGLLMVIMATIDQLIRKTDVHGLITWSVIYAFLTVMFDFISGLIKMNLDYGLYHAQFTATIFFFLAFYYSPKKWIKYPMILIALLCKSATGYCGMAAGMIASLLAGNKKQRKWGLVLATGIVVATMLVGYDTLLNNTVFISKNEVMKDGQFDMEKTSGRDKIWETAINRVESDGKRWTGYGFVAGETYFTYSYIGTNVIGLHNGFLSAYVGTGVIGFVLFALFMLGYVRNTFYKGFSGSLRALLIASMFLVLVHTLGNPGLGFRVYGTWMPAMYIVIMTLGLRFALQRKRFK